MARSNPPAPFSGVGRVQGQGHRPRHGHRHAHAPSGDHRLQAAFEVALTAKDGEIAALRETLTAERGRADRAVAAMAGLNGHLVDLSAKLADNQAELVAAQIAQGEAEADAAELRQAEAERRARGVLARLRAAWRGE